MVIMIVYPAIMLLVPVKLNVSSEGELNTW